MTDKRTYRMPFRHWRDADTINFEKTQPEMVDPENCFNLLKWTGPDGQFYLLNNKNRTYFSRGGPFVPPYFSADAIEDKFAGQDAFIFCPGPSMARISTSAFDGRLTIAVNSAGFKIESTYWCMYESNYMIWLREQKKIPVGREWIMSPRCAVRWRAWGLTPKVKAVYVPRFEELRIMPHRTPAVGVMSALVSAWWLGAKRAFLIGMDLSRPKGIPYVPGVPYSAFGASNPFDEQILALRQFQLPDFTVVNGSPHSQDRLPFLKMAYPEIEAVARGGAA